MDVRVRKGQYGSSIPRRALLKAAAGGRRPHPGGAVSDDSPYWPPSGHPAPPGIPRKAPPETVHDLQVAPEASPQARHQFIRFDSSRGRVLVR